MPAHHEILVTLQDNGYVVSKAPDNIMEVKDTVQYKSVNAAGKAIGEATIRFLNNHSPFRQTVVSSNDPPLELINDGKFDYRCSITIGWDSDNKNAGGNMDVR